MWSKLNSCYDTLLSPVGQRVLQFVQQDVLSTRDISKFCSFALQEEAKADEIESALQYISCQTNLDETIAPQRKDEISLFLVQLYIKAMVSHVFPTSARCFFYLFEATNGLPPQIIHSIVDILRSHTDFLSKIFEKLSPISFIQLAQSFFNAPMPIHLFANLRANISLLVQEVLPMHEKGICNPFKKRRSNNIPELSTDSNGISTSNFDMVDQELYNNFWKLRRTLSQATPPFTESIISSKIEHWDEFQNLVNAVLLKLENIAVLRIERVTNDGSQSDQLLGPAEHLPSSQLFGMQMASLPVRLQFLIQILIVLHAALIPADKTRVPPSPQIANQITEMVKSVEAFIRKMLDEKCEALVGHALNQEKLWIQLKLTPLDLLDWRKNRKEKDEEEKELNTLITNDLTPQGLIDEMRSAISEDIKPSFKKRSNMFGASGSVDGSMEELLRQMENPDWSRAKQPLLLTQCDPEWSLPQSVANVVDQDDVNKELVTVPEQLQHKFDQLTELMVIHENPANCVDEEYKCKKNRVFCWQFWRLFCRFQLSLFNQLTQKEWSMIDLALMFRRMMGLPDIIPENIPDLSIDTATTCEVAPVEILSTIDNEIVGF
eukprot:GHVL01033351.1.p1 GENE.GHVL01033351.1~~GHVL01033351.1.p1  ORF type:complete len:605 (+),score=92.58 GHVL01033351.1:24-1838(+)